MSRFAICICCSLLLSFVWSTPAFAAVVNANSCSDTDVQNAIDSASNGDTVSVPVDRVHGRRK